MMLDMSIYEIPGGNVGYLAGGDARKERETHTDDVGCASLCGKHREYSCAAPDIQHGLIFEEMGIVDDRGTIRTRAHGVLQHLLMNT